MTFPALVTFVSNAVSINDIDNTTLNPGLALALSPNNPNALGSVGP
jgi:hypothetical protein